MSAAWKWPTAFAEASASQGGHTILSRAGGPAFLLLERACGEPAEEGGGSRPDLASGRHHGSRYAADPERTLRPVRRSLGEGGRRVA